MTRAALPSSEILVGVSFEEDKRVRELVANASNACFVLWPGEGSLPAEDLAPVLGQRRPVIFLLDGTWPCARKMYRTSPVLQQMPKISLTPTRVSRFQIKQQPNAQCLSTVEATQLLFETLEKAGVEEKREWDKLTVPFEALNRRQIEIAMDPNRQGYRRKTKPDPEKILERMMAGTRQRKLF